MSARLMCHRDVPDATGCAPFSDDEAKDLLSFVVGEWISRRNSVTPGNALRYVFVWLSCIL